MENSRYDTPTGLPLSFCIYISPALSLSLPQLPSSLCPLYPSGGLSPIWGPWAEIGAGLGSRGLWETGQAMLLRLPGAFPGLVSTAWSCRDSDYVLETIASVIKTSHIPQEGHRQPLPRGPAQQCGQRGESGRGAGLEAFTPYNSVVSSRTPPSSGVPGVAKKVRDCLSGQGQQSISAAPRLGKDSFTIPWLSPESLKVAVT